MAKNDNLKDFLTDVADAIREKKGTTDLINPQDFSAEIASIQSGGGAVAVSANAVNLIDYEGSILHSYTKDEFMALAEFPSPPVHEGLTFQEWNWEFEDAKDYVNQYGKLDVGANYITDDGKTRLHINIYAIERNNVTLSFSQSVPNGVSIDWGDGNISQTGTNTGVVTLNHQYNEVGDYIITLSPSDDCQINLVTYLFTNEKPYAKVLKKVEFGKNISIKGSAFQYCSSLESVAFTKSAYSEGMSIFEGCTSLKCAVIPRDVTIVSTYVFRYCYAMKSLVLPKTITIMNAYSSVSCSQMWRICFSRQVTLGNYAFASCSSLVEVIAPNGFVSLPMYAFNGCEGLLIMDLSKSESVPTMENKNAFTKIPSDCKIIVPDALYDTWIAATNWSTYASYIIKKSDWDAQNA